MKGVKGVNGDEDEEEDEGEDEEEDEGELALRKLIEVVVLMLILQY